MALVVVDGSRCPGAISNRIGRHGDPKLSVASFMRGSELLWFCSSRRVVEIDLGLNLAYLSGSRGLMAVAPPWMLDNR